MENNSKDTLFGFEAISDIFTENNKSTTLLTNTPDNDDLSDEELEELKQQSAKSRPATPGSKNKQVEEDEEDEDEPVKDNNKKEP